MVRKALFLVLIRAVIATTVIYVIYCLFGITFNTKVAVCVYLLAVLYNFLTLKMEQEVIQLARKKKETELSPEEERRLEITKKLNKEQKLFCYHFIVEDKSMKDAYKAAYP